MALAHFHVTPYHVGGERLATGRIHYITRQAEYAPDAQARVLHQGMTAGAAHKREDLVEWNHANLPTWSADDPIRYFSAAEVRERKGNAPCYEEWRFSLPQELSLSQQQAAAHAFLQSAFGDRHPHVYAIHNPRTVDGTMDQGHCHVIFSRRVNDGIERTEAQWFRKYTSRDPAQGGAQRSKRFGHLHSVKADRALYCDTMNVFLDAAGKEARLHPDTLESRGFDREREPRAKPSDSNKAKYQGEITKDWQKILDHRDTYAPDKVLEEVQAQQAWDVRKTQLGITAVMPLEACLERVRAAREQVITAAPGRVSAHELAQQAQTLEHSLSEIGVYLRTVQVEHRVERLYEERGQARPRGGQARAEQLLAKGRALGLDGDETVRLAKPLIGNRVSKIYHEPTHKNYGDVHPKNQVLFWSVQEAKDAGYRRAANDHYGPGTGKAMEVVEGSTRRQKGGLGARTGPDRLAALRTHLQARRQAQLQSTVGGVAKGRAVGSAGKLLEDHPIGPGVKPPIDRTQEHGHGW